MHHARITLSALGSNRTRISLCLPTGADIDLSQQAAAAWASLSGQAYHAEDMHATTCATVPSTHAYDDLLGLPGRTASQVTTSSRTNRSAGQALFLDTDFCILI